MQEQPSQCVSRRVIVKSDELMDIFAQFAAQFAAEGGAACYDVLLEGSAIDLPLMANKIIDFMENK